MILAGDVGGTKVHLALYRFERGALEHVRDRKFPATQYPDLVSVVREFLAEATAQEVIDAACFGVPGPVRKNVIQLTNLPWLLDSRELSRALGIEHLSVTPENASPDGPIHVAFDLKNTCQRAGAEVAQIYVGDPSASVPRPKMELKEFRRVMLQPGETRRVTVALDRRSLAYWDVKTHGWKVDPGKFIVYAGDSSENVPLRKAITVQ